MKLNLCPTLVQLYLLLLSTALLTTAIKNGSGSSMIAFAFHFPSRVAVRPPGGLVTTARTRMPHRNVALAAALYDGPLPDDEEQEEADESQQSFEKKSQLRAFLKKDISNKPLLSSLDDVQLEVLVQLMKERKVNKDDDLLFENGEKATEIYFVSNGKFESFEFDEDGNEVKLFSYEAGDDIGLLSYASDKPYLFNVRAVSKEASVWYIEKDVIDEILKNKKGEVKSSIMSKFSAKDSKFATYLEDRAKYDVIASCGGVFDDLTENDKQAIAKKLVLVDRLSKGQNLCNEGEQEENPDLYIVEEGLLEAYKAKKPKEVLKKYTKGSYFGELSVLLYRPRAASVRVASDSTKVYALSRNDMLRAVEESDLSNISTEQLVQQYKGNKNRISFKDRYEIYRLKSLPKKKPVSPHSVLSTMVVAASLLTMMPHFAPSIGKNGFRIFHLVFQNATPEHCMLLKACNFGLLLSMLGGFLRFPQRGQTVRKTVFTAIGAGQIFHTLVALSNLMGPVYLIDAWSWWGRALIYGSYMSMAFFTGVLWNISLFGPKMTDTPFFENHWRAFLSTTVFSFSNFIQLYFSVLPLLDSRGMFESVTYPLMDACAPGNTQCRFLFAKLMTNLYLGFGGFIATLQFEKKFSVRTCNIMLGGWATFLLGDMYIFILNFCRLAMTGTHPAHMQLMSYFTSRIKLIAQAYFGTQVLCMLYGAFQSIVKKKQMVGPFMWKKKDDQVMAEV